MRCALKRRDARWYAQASVAGSRGKQLVTASRQLSWSPKVKGWTGHLWQARQGRMLRPPTIAQTETKNSMNDLHVHLHAQYLTPWGRTLAPYRDRRNTWTSNLKGVQDTVLGCINGKQFSIVCCAPNLPMNTSIGENGKEKNCNRNWHRFRV